MKEKTIKPDSQARDWGFVINNPKLTEQELFDYLQSLVNVRYFVFAREKGNGSINNPDGTEHYQGYIEFLSPKKFSTMKGYFSADRIGVNAHISPRQYSRQSCVDYVKKVGLHADKADTRIGEVYEYGNPPQQGKRNDIEVDLKQMVEMKKQGYSDMEIFEAFPHAHARFHNYVEKIAMGYKMNPYKKQRRELEVVYIFGKSGIGKTSYVMNKYGDENVFRLTDYGTTGDPIFDDYSGQDVIVFEEFRSSVKIEKMLNYLDIYPTTLHARYNDKTACYTKVYILTNISIIEQYPIDFAEHFTTWQAFIRRINRIYNFDISKTEPQKEIIFHSRCVSTGNHKCIIIYNESDYCYNCMGYDEYERQQNDLALQALGIDRLLNEENKPP